MNSNAYHLLQTLVPTPDDRFRRVGRFTAFPGLAVAASLCLTLVTPPAEAASFQESGGFVVMEAENFDLNVTQPGNQWVFDSTALTNTVSPGPGDPYSGWGYLKAQGLGGISTNFSPRADYKVNFTTTGPHYIWVSGSDVGGNSLHMGLDGIVTTNSANIGDQFGLEGELCWEGYNNTGLGYFSRPYLNVTTTGEHTVNLFIRENRFYVDRIVLTTDVNFTPSPTCGGTNSGANVPAQTLASSANLAVAITQPDTGKAFASNTVVTVVAKPFTNGPAVSKIEFFAKLLPSGTTNKIGEVTAQPYQIGWTNPPVGNYDLTAVVTDSGTATATSAVVNVAIFVPDTCPTLLTWTTNNFDAGLGNFTVMNLNHWTNPNPVYYFDLDWSNTTNAGGPAGELGGRVIRMATIVPYVAAPLPGLLSRNDELWFRYNAGFVDVSANNDIFFGYFDTNTYARCGLKMREPNTSGWRFRAISDDQQSPDLPGRIPNNSWGPCEFHWIPSGLGDGSGTVTGMVNNVGFTNTFAARGATFNAFGLFVPAQGADEPFIEYYAWVDTVRYRIPGGVTPILTAQRGGNQVVLSWGTEGYLLQYNDSSITNSSGWEVSPDSVVMVGGTYYSTNTISSPTRFFRLRRNCP